MRLSLCIMLVFAVASCEKKRSERSAIRAAPPPVAHSEEVHGPCAIRGRVVLIGAPPPMKEIENQPCHAGAPKLKEETVVVGNDGGLANTFVRIEGLPPTDGSKLPAATLDQVHCRYVPHAIGVCVGQNLRVRSSDDTMHNVHWDPQTNEPANFGMTRAGSEKTVSFRASEFIKVRCDVHPWMSATIGVFDNRFFAVTDSDGRFEIKDLPAGQYKLMAWHERYGEQQQEIDVKEGVPISCQIIYKPPGNK